MRVSRAVGQTGQCAVASAVLLMALVACTGKSSEVGRFKSPDGVVEAVIVERASDATVATPIEVYLVPIGTPVSGEPLLTGDRFENLFLTWREPRLLELRYTKGRVYKFTNFWQSADVDQFRYVVELRLKPSSDSFALP